MTTLHTNQFSFFLYLLIWINVLTKKSWELNEKGIDGLAIINIYIFKKLWVEDENNNVKVKVIKISVNRTIGEA